MGSEGRKSLNWLEGRFFADILNFNHFRRSTVKMLSRSIIIFFFASVLLFFYSPSSKAGLIEPTRTLRGTTEEMGKLSLYSEPPGLEVTLDGNEIGKTPVIEKDIEPGSHVVQIKKSKKEIFIIPGQPLAISWFKDSFIEIPIKKQPQPPPPTTVSEKPAKEGQPAEQAKKKQEWEDQFYWPVNPRGPIY
jgi:hypothetical protein